jgi:glucosyl-dolichyl phosphate glucuronosyltransferase
MIASIVGEGFNGMIYDVSVAISTYNRCELLPTALEGVLAQETGGVRYEVIVVDNNSTDNTRQVVESYVARCQANLRYVFEGKQGISHGRNAGLSNARAPIIAYTDDDVHVAPDWVAAVKRAFDEHPEVDYVGGKVLAKWESEPPSWLTREHWSPLALLDYGDAPFHVSLENQVCLITANAAFRCDMVRRAGMFSPSFQHAGVCSVDDHEFQVRLWRMGGKGLYDPRLTVIAGVQSERMTKRYHRKWHAGHGRQLAKMCLEEVERSARGQLFDVPAHLYKQAAMDVVAWLEHSLRGNDSEAFRRETQLRSFLGFFRQRREDFLSNEERSTAREIVSFIMSLIGGKARSKMPKEIG